MEDQHDDVVVGVDTDGGLLMSGPDVEPYNCGETLEEFGACNLRLEELKAVGLTAQQASRIHDQNVITGHIDTLPEWYVPEEPI